MTNIKTSWFTFGSAHHHYIGDTHFGPNTIVKITGENPRELMFKTFGARWSFEYEREEIKSYVRDYGGTIIKLADVLAEKTPTEGDQA